MRTVKDGHAEKELLDHMLSPFHFTYIINKSQ